MIPSLTILEISMPKHLRDEGVQFDATGYETVEVRFVRKSKDITASIEYPNNPPDEQTNLELATDDTARELLCPGCSDQDVALKRCHGCILSDHIHLKYPDKIPPNPRGMLGVYPPSRMVELLDNEANVFIGRRAPRGVATKSVGVKRTIHRSRYANPFIISKKGFTLGESLALYKIWIEKECHVLSNSQIQSSISTAPSMPETIEEMMVSHPELFK